MDTALREMRLLLNQLTLSTKEVQRFKLGNILKVLWCVFLSGAIVMFSVLSGAGLLSDLQSSTSAVFAINHLVEHYSRIFNYLKRHV